MSEAFPRTIDQRTAEMPEASGDSVGAFMARLSRPTDCDFHPSSSPERDRDILDQAGIRRIVVNLADWPDLKPWRWGRAVRAVIDAGALAGADLAALHASGVRGVRVGLATASDIDALPALAERIVALRWHLELDLRLRADRALIADAVICNMRELITEGLKIPG